MKAQSVLEVEELRVYYYTDSGIVRAVDGASLTVDRGELVALVGESGSGKTTLAYAVMRLVPPPGRIVGGRITLSGINVLELPEEEVRKLRWRRVSMVFQGAMNSLNPVMRVGDQIAEVLLYHDAVSDLEEGRRIARELLKLVGLDPERVDSYPHELSGGQKQRVVIAMALALNPDLVIADEPTTGLDVTTQAKIMDTIRSIQRETGISVLLITHDLPLVAEVADRVYVMYAGEIVEAGDVDRIFYKPLHPYTQGLIGAVPSHIGPKKKLVALPGEPPDLRYPPPGCRFHPRCFYAMPVCRERKPPVVASSPRDFVACWLYREKRGGGSG
ncbi:MAG: ABC transporter ATP-binding protein [Thermoproteota archaeon]